MANGVEILNLNVGGELFAVTRGAMLQAPATSLLFHLFTPDSMMLSNLDANQRPFLDYPATAFRHIADHLRLLSQLPAENVLQPLKVPSHQEKQVRELAWILGVEDLMFSPQYGRDRVPQITSSKVATFLLCEALAFKASRKSITTCEFKELAGFESAEFGLALEAPTCYAHLNHSHNVQAPCSFDSGYHLADMQVRTDQSVESGRPASIGLTGNAPLTFQWIKLEQAPQEKRTGLALAAQDLAGQECVFQVLSTIPEVGLHYRF
eukprot:Skav224280  [mRNA]  locus=scaffold1019:19533:25667:+ [translate_table: standard]